MKRFCFLLSALALALMSFGQTASNKLTREMGIDQKLGAQVPLDVPFKDEGGHDVTLRTYMGQRPVVLLPIFYKCQSGCAVLTDSLLQTLLKASHPTGMMGIVQKGEANHPLKLGKDLDVVMLGIDPTETPIDAATKKNAIMNALSDPAGEAHWHMLTGTYPNILKVTNAVGFRYYYNPKTQVIRHPTCSVILTPDGKISTYTIGNEFPSHMLESGLKVASKNRIGQTADQSFMFGCLMLDPETKHIGIVVEGIVRLASLFTFLVLSIGIFRMVMHERATMAKSGGKIRGA